MDPLRTQVFIFLVTVLAGALIGLIFDVYRTFRGFVKPGELGTTLGDFIFWAVATVLTFALLVATNGGEVRAFVFIGMGIGFGLYRATLGPIAIRSFAAFFKLGTRAADSATRSALRVSRAGRTFAARLRETRPLRAAGLLLSGVLHGAKRARPRGPHRA